MYFADHVDFSKLLLWRVKLTLVVIQLAGHTAGYHHFSYVSCLHPNLAFFVLLWSNDSRVSLSMFELMYTVYLSKLQSTLASHSPHQQFFKWAEMTNYSLFGLVEETQHLIQMCIFTTRITTCTLICRSRLSLILWMTDGSMQPEQQVFQAERRITSLFV